MLSRPPSFPISALTPIASTNRTISIAYMARHVENTVGLDDQETDAFVGKFCFRQQSPDQCEAKSEANAVYDRMTHRGQINFLHHLPCAGAEAAADADKNFVYLPHSGSNVECNGKETGQSAECHFGFRPNPEPHDHHRKENDLWSRAEIIEIGLEGSGQKAIGAKNEPDHEAGGATDRQGRKNFSGGDPEVIIVVAVGEQCGHCAPDGQQRWHDVAVKPARVGEEFPRCQHRQDDGDTQQRHRADCRGGNRLLA